MPGFFFAWIFIDKPVLSNWFADQTTQCSRKLLFPGIKTAPVSPEVNDRLMLKNLKKVITYYISIHKSIRIILNAAFNAGKFLFTYTTGLRITYGL
jgi:hypothetical protein